MDSKETATCKRNHPWPVFGETAYKTDVMEAEEEPFLREQDLAYEPDREAPQEDWIWFHSLEKNGATKQEIFKKP